MSGDMIIRKDVKTLSPTEKRDFIDAVKGLKSKYNGNSISRYDQYVEWHAKAMGKMVDGVRNLAHSGPIFLPWHREFIRRFELDLQTIVPEVSLPYWNWVEDSNDPENSLIWSEDFMGGNGDPTYTHPSIDFVPTAQTGYVVNKGPFRYNPDDPNGWNVPIYDDQTGNPVIINGKHRREPLLRWLGKEEEKLPNVDLYKFPTPSDIQAVLELVPYDSPDWFEHTDDENLSFRNILEGWHQGLPVELHNCIHVWVGGTMQALYSPGDPIFFLNHCNVDRIWAEWQNMDNHIDRDYPPDGTVTRPDGTLIKGNNRSEKMFPWDNVMEGNPTIESVLNHRLLGYRYDTETP